MKKILFIAIFAVIALVSHAQKVNVCEVSNDILLINTTDYTLKFEHDFNIDLEKFNDGTNVQYFIKGVSEKNEAQYFPEEAKLLFKTMDGNVIQLTAYYSYIDYIEKKNDYYPTIYYPITEEQLQTLFKGISKIRVEMLSVDKDDVIFQDFKDQEYKKDKLGSVLKKMYDAIAGQEKNLANQAEKAATVKDASDGF